MLCIRTVAWCADNAFAGTKACILPFVDLAPEKGEQDRKMAFSDAVRSEIQAAGFEILPLGRTAGAGEAGAAISAGLSCGADLAVSGFFSLEGDRVLVSVSCYDVNGGGLTAGFIRNWRFNLGIYTSLHSEMMELWPRVKLSGKSDQGPRATRAVLSSVTFTCAQDGMEVRLAGETSAGRVEGGKLSYETEGLLSGSSLLVEKKMEGFQTAWQTVEVGPEIPLKPLRRESSYAIETNWTAGQLLGAGAAFRYYTIPDWFFVAASFYPYGQYSQTTGANTVLHFDLGLQAGGYLLGEPDSLFRLGASSGVGMIVSTVFYSQPVYTDLYLNVANLWLELNFPRVAFFLRPELKYSLGTGTHALEKDIMHWEYGIPVTLGALFRW
jgi:hypothetical protein